MKTYFFLICICVLSFTVMAQNRKFYVSAGGNDAYTVAQAQNPATPWKTLDKVNASMATFQPADTVAFRNTDIFHGKLVVTTSGTAGNDVVFTSYSSAGSGGQATISGFQPLPTWTTVAGRANVWEAPLDAGARVKVVSYNGALRAPGRWPNDNTTDGGFITVESYAGNNQITASGIAGAPASMVDADWIMKTYTWSIDRETVTSHEGTTIQFTNNIYTFTPSPGFGGFFQNHPATLDLPGEWYYNPATNRLWLYSVANPQTSGVMAGQADTLVEVTGQQYIAFINLRFEGSNRNGFVIQNSDFGTVQDCNIRYCGDAGISGGYSRTGWRIVNNYIHDCLNAGLAMDGTQNVLVKGNLIERIGLIPGSGFNGPAQHVGVQVGGWPAINNVVDSNTIRYIGMNGCNFTGTNSRFTRNLVHDYCLTLSDGGAMSTWSAVPVADLMYPVFEAGRLVQDNIIFNGIGNYFGTPEPVPGGVNGIYTDDRSDSVTILHNFVAKVTRAGVMCHNAHNNRISGNVIYKAASVGIHLLDDPIANQWTDIQQGHRITRNHIIQPYNKLHELSQYGSLIAIDATDTGATVAGAGYVDSNFYYRPILDKGTLFVGNNAAYDLPGWQGSYGHDINSKFDRLPAYQFKITGPATGPDLNAYGSSVTFTSNEPNYVLAGGGYQLQGGKIYRTSMIVQGPAGPGSSLNLKLIRAGDPGYGVVHTGMITIPVSSVATRQEFYFYMPADTLNYSVMFNFQNQYGTSWPITLSSIETREMPGVITDMDTLERIEYNQSATPKRVDLGGEIYRDYKGNYHYGYIIIQPYEGTVIYKTGLKSVFILNL